MYARRPLFRLASPRLASFRFASKSEFLYRRAHTRIRVIYVDIGEKNQFVRSFLLDILILPSLFLLALCLLYLRKPTHCSVQLARENNSTPSFLFAHSSLTGKKGILDLVRRSNRSRPNFLRLFHDIDRKLDSLVYQYRKLSRFSSFSSRVSSSLF